jgi:hypothetical protein
MLKTNEVEAKLGKWCQYVHQTIRPMPENLIDRCLSLTYSHVTGSPDRPLQVFDGFSLNEVGETMFGRAMTVRARFGLANYNAVEIGMLLDVHFLIVLAFVERYGMDWGIKMDVKLLKRMRDKHTLFHYVHDEMWHTPETFHYVYGTPVKQVLKCLQEGKVPDCLRTSDVARMKYFKQYAEELGVVRDGFGPASNFLRIPLYRELHITRTDPRKRPTPVARKETA